MWHICGVGRRRPVSSSQRKPFPLLFLRSHNSKSKGERESRWLDRQDKIEAVKATSQRIISRKAMFITLFTIIKDVLPWRPACTSYRGDPNQSCLRNDQPKCKGKQALRDAREINAKYKSPNMFVRRRGAATTHPSPATRFLTPYYHAKRRKHKQGTKEKNTPNLAHA
jgi:hypothetical protein